MLTLLKPVLVTVPTLGPHSHDPPRSRFIGAKTAHKQTWSRQVKSFFVEVYFLEKKKLRENVARTCRVLSDLGCGNEI